MGPQVTFFNIWLRRFRLDQNPIESKIIFSAVSTTLGVKANFQKHGFSQKKKFIQVNEIVNTLKMSIKNESTKKNQT